MELRHAELTGAARRFAIVVVLLVLATTAVAFGSERSAERARRELAFRQAATPVILESLQQISAAQDTVEAVRLRALTETDPAVAVAGGSTDGTSGALASVAIVEAVPNGTPGRTLAAKPVAATLSPSPGLARAAALAVDSGEIRAAPPASDGSVALLAAVYTGGSVPARVIDRRATARWFVAGVIRPTAVLRAGLDAASTVDVGVDLRQGARSLVPAPARDQIPALTGDPVIDRPVAVGGTTWHLDIGFVGKRAGTPWEAWLVLAIGLLLAGLVVGLVETMVRAQRRALRAAESRAREVALIAELGPVLQESLDLGDLLPAVLVRLADEVHADRLSVLVAGEHGALVELFAIGAPLPDPPGTVAQLRAAPDVVPAGEVVDFPLQRAGRTIGALRLRTHQTLEAGSLQALRAAIELVAASVANALLFQREQDTVVRLRDVDQLKTAFLGTASHELRTPVTAIRGFSELLVRKWDELSDEQRVDFVRRIARNATSLSTLVGDLLDFARIERGEVRLATQALDFGALVALLVDELATVFSDHRFDIDAEPGIMAMADADAVERIVSNLVANAAKFAPPASTVTVAVHEVGHRVELIVDDEGPGVPESERQRIFSRFYRGEGEAVVRTRGVGIGLSVVHDLTSRMGGTVTVADAPSGGARFRVELPAAADAASGGSLADATPGGRR